MRPGSSGCRFSPHRLGCLGAVVPWTQAIEEEASAAVVECAAPRSEGACLLVEGSGVVEGPGVGSSLDVVVLPAKEKAVGPHVKGVSKT